MGLKTVRVAGWRRRSLAVQVGEALARLTEPTPYQTWPGGIVIGARAFTTRELADRLLDGGAAVAEGRATTILAPTTLTARSLWTALGVCACTDHPDVAVVASRPTGNGRRIYIATCGPCGATAAGLGYDVMPIIEITAVGSGS